MKIRYTPAALGRLARILDYIAKHSPQGAQHVQARIQATVALAAQYPYAGRSAGRHGRRRLVVSPYPYFVIYSVVDDEIVIHTVRHTARRSIEQ